MISGRERERNSFALDDFALILQRERGREKGRYRGRERGREGV